MSETTVRRGVEELEAGRASLPIGRVRAPDAHPGQMTPDADFS
ncbi:hypothetical protein P3T36_007188 [Kitasatospora sp. MAP12-15]|nr:hypothetical protein [Kitasatospora sp. MAP12-44]